MTRFLALVAAALLALAPLAPASAQGTLTAGSMEQVYRGPIRLPDFNGRDHKYNDFRTRIRNAMSAGPDFAGHYAIIQIGCGTSCNFAYMGDVATGQVFDFPYGGENNSQMEIFRSPKSNRALVIWVKDGRCMRDALAWDGARFASERVMDIGP